MVEVFPSPSHPGGAQVEQPGLDRQCAVGDSTGVRGVIGGQCSNVKIHEKRSDTSTGALNYPDVSTGCLR